ncbi:major facilitator superfamily domain-containing protein [Ilyonectria sp. MPI-CAGE-AT-0026]|nr:major facilitator superfamily domain-containing protein [Ilyonectria sp. MPI-CAGE-AT-0026]
MANDTIELDVPGTQQLLTGKFVGKEDDTSQGSPGGEIILTPAPSAAAGDPLRWSRPKKYFQLFLLSLYALIAAFSLYNLGGAWVTINEDTGISFTNMNGGSGLNYLLIGVGNLFWIPLAMKIGRRPVFLLSASISLGGNLWLYYVNSAASWYVIMVICGFGAAICQALIQLCVFDIFYAQERGTMIAVTLLGQELGVVLGVATGGKVTDDLGWRWVVLTTILVVGISLVCFAVGFEESLFPRFLFARTAGLDGEAKSSPAVSKTVSATASDTNALPEKFPKRSYLQSLRLWSYYPEDKTTFWTYMQRPFIIFTFPNVLVAGAIFAFGCNAGVVSFTTVAVIMMDEPYLWSNTMAGFMFLSGIIGSILGWATGAASDRLVLYLARRNGGVKEPEMRLWALVPCAVYALVGYNLYGWGAQYSMHWMVIAVGLGFMLTHQVASCTIAATYAMDCFPGVEGELIVVLSIIAPALNIGITFGINTFIETHGFGNAFLCFSMIVLFSFILAVPTYIWGKSWRRRVAPKWRAWLAKHQT